MEIGLTPLINIDPLLRFMELFAARQQDEGFG
jgi:hypothetical protein